jgi:hypothetical protein
VPLAAALNDAVLPEQTVWFVGLEVTDGAVFTVSVAAVVASLPHVFVKTARNLLPVCEEEAVNDSVVPVAPDTSLQLPPLFVLTCHCISGVGVPLAAAVNDAVVPEQTVWFVGFVVTVGGVLTVRVAAVVVLVLQAPVKTARY